MSMPSILNRSLRLYNGLKQGSIVLATFAVLKGGRTAQVLANTGLDVSIGSNMLVSVLRCTVGCNNRLRTWLDLQHLDYQLFRALTSFADNR
jgi:hypothetical protein